VSYVFGLEGPSITLDTACSSSLVALDQARVSLLRGEVDTALASGVDIMHGPNAIKIRSIARMLAPDGRCKTFDARADGYARGEGCGAVVLRRLTDAEIKTDDILAVVKATAVNQDGRTASLTAPNMFSQQRVLRSALREAQIDPADVDYIECHGTGTALGDPIEVDALRTVFGARDRPLVFGAVKTNIAHLEAAAGMAGVVKAVLALRSRVVPANVHFQTLNPYINVDNLEARFPTEEAALEAGKELVAGVSSFGFGGTNAHCILSGVEDDAPAPKKLCFLFTGQGSQLAGMGRSCTRRTRSSARRSTNAPSSRRRGSRSRCSV
jgi:acyl transferase domain-containing protein